MNPLLRAPAHEEDLRRVGKLVAEARAALSRGYDVATALLQSRPIPSTHLPCCHDAYMAFRREVDPIYAQIYRLSLDVIQAENWAIIEPDSEVRMDLIHCLAGVGYCAHPPIAAWYADVKRRASYGALFQPIEAEQP